MKNAKNSPVSLEDLLRLKRSETPPEEFWDQFDRDLRAKQLAAIVKRRSWWKEAMRSFSGVVRYQVPMGASAALALAFFTIREYRTSDAIMPEVHAIPETSSAVVATVRAQAVSAARAPEVAPLSKTESATDSAASASSLAASSTPAALVPVLVGALPSSSSLSPSARSIAANLAAAQAAEPEVARQLMGPVQAFEARMIPARATLSEPLASVNPGSAERRARFLASALPAVATRPAPTSDRLASHLSDERLYEQISRYGVDADRLSIKF